jgi:hypothetical protein
MFLRIGPSVELLAEIKAAPRAIVCLDVPWSVYPIRAKADLSQALRRLYAMGFLFEAFVLDEESPASQAWIGTLGLPNPYDGGGVPQGWGAILWLEKNRVVSWYHHGHEIKPIGIIQLTKSLWASDSA